MPQKQIIETSCEISSPAEIEVGSKEDVKELNIQISAVESLFLWRLILLSEVSESRTQCLFSRGRTYFRCH